MPTIATPRRSFRPRPQNWNHAESVFVLPGARGGDAFGRKLKEQRIGIERITTDDAEIEMALILRDDEEHQVRVAYVRNVLTDRDIAEGNILGRRREWVVAAVCRARITKRAVLG